jgi:hypothetical protein
VPGTFSAACRPGCAPSWRRCSTASTASRPECSRAAGEQPRRRSTFTTTVPRRSPASRSDRRRRRAEATADSSSHFCPGCGVPGRDGQRFLSALCHRHFADIQVPIKNSCVKSSASGFQSVGSFSSGGMFAATTGCGFCSCGRADVCGRVFPIVARREVTQPAQKPWT